MMKATCCLILFQRKQAKGFTLLELLITMIIVGILSALAYPNFTKQVGKARESEIKFSVGTVNRAQQAYHWEKKQFAQGADDAKSLELLNVSLPSKYISNFNIVGNANNATIAPDNANFDNYQIKAYAGGMFAAAGNYSQVICQSESVAENIPPPVSSSDCGLGVIID